MCKNCDDSGDSVMKWVIALVVVIVGTMGFLAWCEQSRGAEVKAIPLATVNQTESPVIAKAMGLGGKPEAHELPKFDLPPAGEVAAAGIGLLVVVQIIGVVLLCGGSLVVVLILIGKWLRTKTVAAAPPILSALDKLVDSHRSNFSLAKAIHTRLSKVLILDPIAPPKKAPTRKKKVNVTEKSA